MAVAGTLTEVSRTNRSPGTPVQKVRLTWTSDASGVVTERAVTGLSGRITRIVTNPTDGPTDDYDVTVLDEDGIDLLGGAGGNRDTTNTEGATVTTPLDFSGTIYPTIANAGNAKSGAITLYISRV